MITDTVTTDRANVISMIACRYDYGHANQITDDFFWTLLGATLSDADIEDYARSLDPDADAGGEDYRLVHSNLTAWRDEQLMPSSNSYKV